MEFEHIIFIYLKFKRGIDFKSLIYLWFENEQITIPSILSFTEFAWESEHCVIMFNLSVNPFEGYLDIDTCVTWQDAFCGIPKSVTACICVGGWVS